MWTLYCNKTLMLEVSSPEQHAFNWSSTFLIPPRRYWSCENINFELRERNLKLRMLQAKCCKGCWCVWRSSSPPPFFCSFLTLDEKTHKKKKTTRFFYLATIFLPSCPHCWKHMGLARLNSDILRTFVLSKYPVLRVLTITIPMITGISPIPHTLPAYGQEIIPGIIGHLSRWGKWKCPWAFPDCGNEITMTKRRQVSRQWIPEDSWVFFFFNRITFVLLPLLSLQFYRHMSGFPTPPCLFCLHLPC